MDERSCTRVLTHRDAHLTGVPNALVGVAYYATVDFTQMTLSAGPTILLDSLAGYGVETELVVPVQWLVSPGFTPGTTLRFRVRVRDFLDFETVDSLEFQTSP